MQVSHLVLSIILPSFKFQLLSSLKLWSQSSKTAACCCHSLCLTHTPAGDLGKNHLEKPGWMWSFASFVSLLLGRDHSSSDPACTGWSPISPVTLYILSNFYNYSGRKVHLIQVIPLWPEPEAVCYFHLLSPSQNCLGVGSKSFCWQVTDLILVQSIENAMTS